LAYETWSIITKEELLIEENIKQALEDRVYMEGRAKEFIFLQLVFTKTNS